MQDVLRLENWVWQPPFKLHDQISAVIARATLSGNLAHTWYFRE